MRVALTAGLLALVLTSQASVAQEIFWGDPEAYLEGNQEVLALDPLEPPTDLEIGSVTETSVDIRLRDQSTGEAFFIAYVRPEDHGWRRGGSAGGSQPAQATGGSFEVTVDRLLPGRRYCFVVVPVPPRTGQTRVRFDGSNALCTKTAGEFAESPPPAAPTSYVQVGNYFFNISWQDNSVNETGFVVDRRTADSDWQRIQTVVFAGGPNTGTTNGPRYFFVDKEPGSVIDEYRDGVYCFRVGAYHVDATSYDEEICKPTVPRPPLNFRVVAVGYTNVTLSWRDNSNVEEEFVLRRCRADIGEDDTECLEPERIIASWGANGSPPNYTDMTARSDQSYEYSLLVRNASGQRNVRVTATTKPDPGDEPESTEPNLYFSGSITLTPFSVEPNRSFTVSWTGCNSGATSTGDFHDKLLLHKYQTEGSVNERSIKNEPVAPNGCYVNEVEYDGLPEGDYFLDVLLDGTGEVNESREDDNNNSYGFMVAPGD